MDMPFSTSDIVFGFCLTTGILALGLVWASRLQEGRILFLALLAKILAVWANAAVAVYFYEGVADSLAYHEVGTDLAAAIQDYLVQGIGSYLTRDLFFWPTGTSTTRFESLAGLAHFLVGNSFLGSSLLFGLLGFAGQVLLYRTFVRNYPDCRVRIWWWLGILFFPSLTFWSAGLLKDPLGILGSGLAVWGLDHFLRGPQVRYVVAASAGFYCLALFRPQIAPVLLFALIPWIVNNTWGEAGKTAGRRTGNPALRWPVFIGLIFAFLAGIVFVMELESRFSLAEFPETAIEERAKYENLDAGSTVSDRTINDGSWLGILEASPSVLVVPLFRPFFWEGTGSPLQAAAAAENTLLLCLTILGGWRICCQPSLLRHACRSPLFLSCVLFTLCFGLVVGITTPNLGTVSRYRMPLIPFFFGGFVILESVRLRLGLRRLSPNLGGRDRQVQRGLASGRRHEVRPGHGLGQEIG